MSKLKKIIISVIAVVLAALVAAGVAFLVIDNSSSTKVSLSDVAEAPEAYETVDVGTEGYHSLGSYISDNLSSSSSSQKTIVLTGNGPYYVTSQIEIPAGKYITIDLNGASIFASVEESFYVAGTLTIIDSSETITSKGTVEESTTLYLTAGFGNGVSGSYTLEREPGVYEKYSVKTGCIFDYHYSTSQKGEIQIAAGGTLNMYGGAIVGSQSSYDDASSSGTMIYAKGSSSSLATFNMYGGFLCAKQYTNDNGRAVYGSYANVNLYGGLIGHGSGKYGSSTYMCNSGTLNIGGNSVKYGSSNFDAMYIAGNTSSAYGNIYTIGTVNTNVYSNAYIFENSADYGSIIYACGSGKTTLYGGNFFNNTAKRNGGIVITSSPDTLTMSGGYFYGNVSGGDDENNSYNGGAIWLHSGASANITGGTFSHNVGGYGGGICATAGCTVSISGVTFEDNTAWRYGGGLYSGGSGTITIKNSTFTGNHAARGSGGVTSGSGDTLTLSNVTFKNNSSDAYGGALRINGSATISNSTFTGNTAKTYGGAIGFTGTSLSISDTEISGNTAGTYGGGLYMNGSGDVSLSGLVTIDGNTAGTEAGEDDNITAPYGPNVCMLEGYIALGGTLSSSSSIGVTLTGDGTQITSAETSTSRYKTSAQYFFLDEDETRFVGWLSGDAYLSAISKDEATITVTKGDNTYYSNDLATAVATAAGTSEGDAGTITLERDVDVDATVTVEAGTYVALDLNGCTVTWTGSTQSNFFLVYGLLDLYDSEAAGGKLKDEDNPTPGVTAVATETGTQYETVYGVMDEKGETTYYYYRSGAITGGQATSGVSGSGTTSRGGAVYVASGAAFNMYGGTLYNNTATYGGAVHSYGTFNMYGGAISENYSTNSSTNYNGAAMLIEGDAAANLFGGVIYGNVASGKGRGIIDNLGTLLLAKFDKCDTDEEKARYAGYDTDELGPVISGNTSSGYGGILNRGSLTMNAGYITLNHADYEGGGVNTNGFGFTMTGGYITGNTTSYYGAGVHVVDTFTMTGGYISYNESTKELFQNNFFNLYWGELYNSTFQTGHTTRSLLS